MATDGGPGVEAGRAVAAAQGAPGEVFPCQEEHLPRLLAGAPPGNDLVDFEGPRRADPGGDPRRADDPAIVHEATVGVNRRLRGDLPQKVNGPLVGRRLQAVEQPGLRQEQGPGADRQDQFGLLGASLDPVGQHGVVHLPPGALTTGDQQQIEPWAVRQAVVRIDAEATTHHGAIDLLREVAPKTTVHADRRFVDNGRVVCSAGIAAGIDMSLHVVARLLGREVAKKTARQMEYPWQPTV